MKYIVLLVLLVGSFSSNAADGDSLKTKPKLIRYAFSINSNVSLCASCDTESTLAIPSTIHGIQIGRLRLGGGIAYTSFGMVRAMPYFGSAMFNLYGKKNKNGVFFELNYGKSHTWLRPGIGDTSYLKEVRGTDFFQISTGYAYHYYKLRLAAQVGFQSFNASQRYEYGTGREYYNLNFVYVPPADMTVERTLRRIFLGISIGL